MDEGALDAPWGGRRIGCLLVARFPLACELVGRSELWRRPVVVAHPEAAVVWSVSPLALAEGVREGQRLSEAIGRCPTLVVLDGRPARYEAQDAAMLDALEQVTPGVEPAGLGRAYVDLSGLYRSAGSPGALHAALLACAPEALRPRLGVGPTKFVAALAASQAGGEEARGTPEKVQMVAEAEIATFLAPVPVDALPVDAEVVRRLRLVGLTTVGALADLPRPALIAQFGSEGQRLARLLDGVPEPVRPRPRRERLCERLILTEPLTSRGAVLAAAHHVLDRVVRSPRRGDRVARQVAVRVRTDQGKLWESTVTLREPRGDHAGMWVALAPALERASFSGPVSELAVELRGLRPVRGWRRRLVPDPYTSQKARREQVEESLRQLRVRYGRSLVGRMMPVEPWNRIPERRWALVEME